MCLAKKQAGKLSSASYRVAVAVDPDQQAPVPADWPPESLNRQT